LEFIDLSKQYNILKPKLEKRISQVLSRGTYIMGPEVEELEERLACFTGVKHVVTCANGTDALTLALRTFDVGPGDAVFCPTFTFFATGEAAALCGATPIFVDIDPDTFNICPRDLRAKAEAVCNATNLIPKAVIAVDLFGLPANYVDLNLTAKSFGMFVIEDGAQGFGGRIDNKAACSFGDIATTSFFPAKPLGCYGDGGALFTDCDDTAALLKSLRVHGKGSSKYDNIRVGYNSRLDTIQAAILLEKLEIFPDELKARNKVAAQYQKLLKNSFVAPEIPAGYSSSWAQYTLKTHNRDELMEHMARHQIPATVYYSKCLHQQEAFLALELPDTGKCSTSEVVCNSVLSLPMHPYLGHSDQEKIVECLLKFEAQEAKG